MLVGLTIWLMKRVDAYWYRDSLDSLVESLRWFDHNRDRLPEMSRAARIKAERCTWEQYRRRVTEAVAPLV